MNYATIKKNDIANGPGIRVSLYVSGCTHHCKDCFNPETWSFNYGKSFTNETLDEIIKAMSHEYIKGFSLLGGEPFEVQNQGTLVKVLRKIKKIYPEKDIWCYTGYLMDDQLLKYKVGTKENVDNMLSYIDILVDGEFQPENKVLDLRFRGSTNQRIIDVKKSLEKGSVILWKDDIEI